MGLYKGNQRFEEHDFIAFRRYKAIAHYPEPKHGKWHKIGDIEEIRNNQIVIGEDFYISNPLLFKVLDWCEERSFEEIFTLRFIQMSEPYSGNYYIPGDILEIDGFAIDGDRLDPVFIGFKVKGRTIKPDECIPLRYYKQYDRIHTKEIYANSK